MDSTPGFAANCLCHSYNLLSRRILYMSKTLGLLVFQMMLLVILIFNKIRIIMAKVASNFE